ncbi:hypothetical protein KEJ37_06940 [Candidatus Bathyarchaeota archaeon]|nr:hypothetical protein [Candidatus Bathyarchaeota archaeon]
MGLYEELSQTYPLEDIYPYGLVLIVPKEVFKSEWESTLKNENVQIYTNSYNGRICFFLRKKEDGQNQSKSENVNVQPSTVEQSRKLKARRFEWSQSDLEALKQMRMQGLGIKQISLKLGKPRGSVLGKLKSLKKLQTQNLQPQTRNFEDDGLFKEYLEASQILYPKYRRACLLLLKKAEEVLSEA